MEHNEDHHSETLTKRRPVGKFFRSFDSQYGTTIDREMGDIEREDKPRVEKTQKREDGVNS